MRDQQERGALFLHKGVQQAQKGLCPCRVEACRGFIREEKRGLGDQRARDRDALLFALGQGGRAPLVSRTREIETVQERVGPRPYARVQLEGGMNPVGEEDVVVGGEVVHEWVVLKDPARGLKSMQPTLSFVGRMERTPGDRQFPRSDRDLTGDQRQER